MPDRLRFAVTLPRRIMRERRFAQAQRRLRQFLSKVAGLGPTPGPPLIQLPPSLRFDPDTSAGFLRAFWDIHTGRIVYEPRHGSWFAHNVDALLTELCIARVAADPAPVPGVRASGGWHGLRDNRLHDSPKIYRWPIRPAPRTHWPAALRSVRLPRLAALGATQHGHSPCETSNRLKMAAA